MNKKIILIGCGGHTKVCADLILQNKSFIIAGVVCDNKNGVYNLPHIGFDKDLKKLRKKYKYALITVGQINSAKKRLRLFDTLKNLNYSLPQIMSKQSMVSKSAKIDEGTIIMDRAVIHQDVEVGSNSIINTGAIIEHDVVVGNNTHVSTGAIINGNVKIGNNVFIGSGSIIVNNIKIKSNSFIKAGTLVKKDI